MGRECVAMVNVFVILREKSRLKMRVLVFLKHAVNLFLSVQWYQ